MLGEALFSSKSPEYITPYFLYKQYDDYFHFTLDPCTTSDNPLRTSKFYTEKEDGLKQSWTGERVYCNPPYGRNIAGRWVQKARDSQAELVVMLLPSRTDTKWFHDYIYKNEQAKIEFLKGRLRFLGEPSSAPFPSMIVIFYREEEE
jgi:phage N-6-adenine-methyltransferase